MSGNEKSGRRRKVKDKKSKESKKSESKNESGKTGKKKSWQETKMKKNVKHIVAYRDENRMGPKQSRENFQGCQYAILL